MKCNVVCEGCKEAIIVCIETDTIEDMGNYLPSLIIACHATTAHCNHSLRYELEDSGMEKDMKSLTIECIQPRCGKKNKILETECPIELVSALTIVFHSSHEGHMLKITYDGKTWQSPE